MRFLFVLVLLLSPITRFPGFFHLVAPTKAAINSLALGSWFVALIARFRQEGGRKENWHFPPAYFAVLFIALLAWTSLTLLFSSVPIAKGGGLLLAQFTVLAFFYPFFDFAAGEKEQWRMVGVLVAAAAAVGGLAILQYVVMQFGLFPFLVDLIIPKLDRDLIMADGSRELPNWGYRSWGPFHHPNLLGGYLAMVFPIAVILVPASKSHFARSLSFTAVLFIGGGIFCSGSRGAWLNLMVGVAVLILLRGQWMKKAWVWAAAAALPILGLIFQSELRQYFRLGNVLSNRDIIWQNTWTLVMEHPFLGRGPGTFSRAYLDRFGFPSEIERGTALRELASLGRIDLLDYWHAHNLFLHYATEMGLFGALLVILIFFAYFKALLKFWWERGFADRGPRALLVAGCSAAVSGNLVHSLLETTTNVSYPAVGIPFICIFATGLASMRPQLKPRTEVG